MEKKQTLWRTFMENPFLHSDEIPKDGINVTILGYDKKAAFSKETGKEESLQIVILKEFKKPVALSNRKAKEIQAQFGKTIEDSIGKQIHLYSVNEKFFGKYMDVLHFKAAKSVVKPTLNSKSENWVSATDAIKAGNTTIQAIEKHYTITTATKKALTDLIPK
jgi:hypothetical protein